MNTDFEMYTEKGNKAVAALVELAKSIQYTWPETLDWLRLLSTRPGYEEAMDTSVRECVYTALEFETDFYC